MWDSLTPNKYRKREEWWDGRRESEEEAAYLWALELYNSDKDKGKDGGDDDGLEGECIHDATACALEWAEEANQLVCEYVLKDDVEGLMGRDLGGKYYEGATGIVDAQIRRGGRRLAKWVNMMAEKWWEEEEGEEESANGSLQVQEL